MKYKLLFFWLFNVLTALFFYYSALDSGRMLELFFSTSYYFMSALVLLWGLTMFRYAQIHWQQIKTVLYENRIGLVLSLVLSVVVFIVVPCGLKVLSDEANVMAVSKSMLFQKRVSNVTEGLWYYNNFYPLAEELELRPLTLPYFTHIIHAISGYRVENVYVLNFILLFVFLFILYYFFQKNFGKTWAVVAQLLVLSQPLMPQLATSGGIDFIYMAFFVITLTSLYLYLKSPGALALLLLVANALLFANTRYEAIFPAVLILVLLLAFKKIKWEQIAPNILVYSFLPLLMLPSLWQRIYKFLDKELPVNEAASFANFISNSRSYVYSITDFTGELPFSAIINMLSILSFVLLLILFVRNKISITQNQKIFSNILLTCLLFMWVIINIFSVSKAYHPSQSRLFLVFVVVGSLLAAWGLNKILLFKKHNYLVIGFALFCFVYYLPHAAENRFVNKQTIMREYDFGLNFLQSHHDTPLAIIYDRPGLFSIHDFGAVSFGRANADGGELLANYKRHLFEKLYTLQEIEYKTMLPVDKHKLHRNYILKPVRELQNSPESFLRISEVLRDSAQFKN